MKHVKILSCLLLAAGFLMFAPTGSSCGPFFPNAVFVNKNRPGSPFQWYTEGHLGVVLPGYRRGDLVMAYRYLAGRPLAKSERDAALAFWRGKYQRTWSAAGAANDSPQKDPVQEWLITRKQVLGADVPPAEIVNYQPDAQNFGGSETCLPDSFRTAVLTLDDRVRRFGNDWSSIQEWIKGQDAVFHDCGPDKTLPSTLPDSSPAWLKADRQYQIAAAHFYSRAFDQAAEDFERIAADAGSPWKNLAPYLVARAIIRKGTLSEAWGEDTLRQAEARLRKIMDDPSQAALHDAAQRLVGYIALRIRRPERNIELAGLLAGPRPDRDFQQDLIDYSWSLDHLDDEPPSWGEPGPPTEEYKKKYQEWVQGRDRRWAAAEAASDLTDWVVNFPDPGPEARDHAVAQWRKQHSLPWLVAALSKVSAQNIEKDKDKDKTVRELLKAAEEVPADSPAYPSVLYHRIRLLIQARENDQARMLLEALLNSPPAHLTGSSRNLFLAQRMRVAADYRDFLVHAPRRALEVDYDDGLFGICDAKACDELLYGGPAQTKTEMRFDGDAASILNLRIPLERLVQAASGTELPEPLRGELAVATWTRAVMLDRHDLAAKLVPEVDTAYPGMKDLLESYLAAKPEEKKYAGLFVILHVPGMRPYVNIGSARSAKMAEIDSYRDNWWCADIGSNAAANYEKGALAGDVAKPATLDNDYPQFLSPEQASAAEREWKKLSKSGSGAAYLAGKTVAWAQEAPQDPLLAEALHYAVRSTRYGCEDANVSALSKQAFKLLHDRFPNSKWAKETPYWF